MPNHDANALPSENELLRSLVDHVSAMLAYWDAGLRCRFANREFREWFDVSPGALIGKHISELLGPLYQLDLPFIEGVLRGEPQEFEREIPSPAGGCPRQALVCFTPDLVQDVVRGFFVQIADLSTIKEAETRHIAEANRIGQERERLLADEQQARAQAEEANEQLRESEERFRLILDEAPIGMALVAPGGRFVRVNRVLCELLGYSTEELTGLTFQEITHPEDRRSDLALVRRLARAEIPRYQLEKRYIRMDGTTVDIMLSVSALRRSDGTPRYYIAQIEDITERRRLEEQLRFLAEIGVELAETLEYDATLTRIAELAVRDLADICIVDMVQDDGSLRRVEVASRDPSKSWLCKLFRDVPIARERPYLLRAALATRRSVLISELSKEMLASLSQSEQHLRALRAAEIRSMVAAPLLAHGKLLGAIALISSSSSRMYGPSDVRLAEELARRAALSIQNARLYRSARRATQARDEILAIVAHDLRNPASTILMQTALLRHGAEPKPEACKPADAIERAATRMLRLIQDLLDETSIEAGRLSIEPTNLSPTQLVADSLERQKPLTSSAALELRPDLKTPLPDVWADRDRLLQVFENLIGNALKFTDPGGQITLGAAPRSTEVLFWVTDTGHGIAAEDLPHLFDRFWQASTRQGAGLGLAIAKGIIEAHHGRIWVESTPGEGTTFCFTIPTASGANAWRADRTTAPR